MIYLDTSVLVGLLVPEPDSAAVRSWLHRHEREELGTSDWTLVEFASAMGIKVRQKALKARDADAARLKLAALAEDNLRVEAPSRSAFANAAAMITDFRLGLRAGDALHLATALEAQTSQFVTLDRKLIQAARRLKLPLKMVAP